MNLTESDIKKLLKSHGGGAFVARYASDLRGMRLWEVWVRSDDEQFHTRYVLETVPQPEYFDDFQAFMTSVNSQLSKAERTGKAIDIDAHLRKLRTYVAAAVFVVATLVMIYLAISDPSQATILATLLGVVASGAAFFFGRWVPAA